MVTFGIVAIPRATIVNIAHTTAMLFFLYKWDHLLNDVPENKDNACP